MKVGTFNVHSPINNKWPGQMVQHYPNFCPWSNFKVIKIQFDATEENYKKNHQMAQYLKNSNNIKDMNTGSIYEI